MADLPQTTNPKPQIPSDDQASAAKQAADDLAKLTAKPVEEASFAEEAEEFEEKQHDFQAAYDAGGPFKEQVERLAKEWPKAPEKMAEIPTTPELGREVAGSMEVVPDDIDLTGGVSADYTEKILLGGRATGGKPKAQIPLTQEQIAEGLHHKIWEGIKWLAEWCMRQLKMVS